MMAGVPLAAMTAVYTAYLFGQAKARDLWQNPLLAPHLLVQALLAGAAVLVPLLAATGILTGRALDPVLHAVALLAIVHLGFAAAETTFVHATAHAALAIHEMVQGRFRVFFWTSVALMAGAAAAPWFQPALAPAKDWILVATPALALAGLLTYEHAYVQAGQSVPLA
jgi:Ni/Fe-hydrogenase subunit HybB-like protein